MIDAAYSHCGVVRKWIGQIYFVGGKDSGKSNMNAGTQLFDMATRTFSTLSGQLSIGRLEHACAMYELESLLVAAGGIKNQWLPTSTVEILNLKTETWTAAKSLPSLGKVWAVGEVVFTWKTSLYQYDPWRNVWLIIEDVPFTLSELREGFKAVEVESTSFCSWI